MICARRHPAAFSANRRRALALVLAAAALVGCAEPEPAAAPPAPAPEPPAAMREIVAGVQMAELGRTHDGFILTATAQTPGAGWRTPRLRPITGVAGPDGVLAFEFIAAPPAVMNAAVSQRLMAHTLLAPEQVMGATTLRVMGADSSADVILAATEPGP